MNHNPPFTRSADLTFRYNHKQGRHGWLRLTPAYSVKVVHQILDANPSLHHVLDPFSGTATTGLVCAERGLHCDLIDINPFLVWFGNVKTRNYTPAELRETETILQNVKLLYEEIPIQHLWIPSIKNIDRWWAKDKQEILAKLYFAVCHAASPARDLLLVAFCQKLIEWSNAAFNHQSMSFKAPTAQLHFGGEFSENLASSFFTSAHHILQTASIQFSGTARIVLGDSRFISASVNDLYDAVITSPPYPNRMSYIRELRPYMYWLEFIREAAEAGELDWRTIGGTWGVATSRVGKWENDGIEIPYDGFKDMIQAIGQRSSLLANYVHKYFVDIYHHLISLKPHLAPGAKLFYVVGNCKFYDTLVPVEKIYASLFESIGLSDVEIEVLRKRNSKSELYEFMVKAVNPHD